MKGLLVVAILLTGVHSVVSQCRASASLTLFNSQPVSVPVSMYRSLLINADNVNNLTTFMDDDIIVGERTISFAMGSFREQLLEIPLAAAGELAPRDTIIRMTVALKPPSATTAHDPIIGISSSTVANRMVLLGGRSSVTCNPVDGGISDFNERPAPHPVPYFYTLILRPLTRYAACETAQNQLGGYVNTMTFSPVAQVDVTNGINFVLYRGGREQYTFYYFLVEIFQ